MRKKIQWVGRALVFLLCVSFAVVFLMPTVLTITNSFMEKSEIAANYGVIFSSLSGGSKTFVSEEVNLKFIPDKVSFSQYKTALIMSPDYLLKFWNSVILVVPVVLGQLLVACFAAYSFTRYRGRFKEVLFFFYIVLMLMPYQVTLVPNYLVSNWLGIYNTRWAIILPGIFAPFAVFLLTKFMRRIPFSLIEAAKLDGAGEFQIFRQVCIPMCRSALYSVAILVFIDYWNMVEQPLILLEDVTLQPLSIFLSKINSTEAGLAFAVATVYMLPTLFMFLHGEEYLVEGITYSGSVKG
jgi:multiple sugar transport system permease protein